MMSYELKIVNKFESVRGLRSDWVAVDRIEIGVGQCISDDGTEIIPVTSLIPLGMPGDLDIGVEAANTWYYIWLFKNPTTGDVTARFSASPTAPTAPAGYTLRRRIGSVRNDAAANFIEFEQLGMESERTYLYLDVVTNRQVLAGGAAVVITAVSVAPFVPPVMSSFKLFARQQGVTNLWLFRSTVTPMLVDVTPRTTYSDPSFLTDAVQQIAYQNAGGGGIVDLYVMGYSEEI